MSEPIIVTKSNAWSYSPLTGLRASDWDRVVINDGVKEVWARDCEIPSIGAMNLPDGIVCLNLLLCKIGTLEGIGRLHKLKELRLPRSRLGEIVELEKLDELYIVVLSPFYTGTFEGLIFPENFCLYLQINPFRNCLEQSEGVYYNPCKELRINTVVTPIFREEDLFDAGWTTTYKCPEIREGTKRTCTKALFKTKEHPYSLQAWCVRTSYLLGGVAWQDFDSALYKNEWQTWENNEGPRMGSVLSLPTISLDSHKEILLKPDKNRKVEWRISPGQDLSKVAFEDTTQTLRLYGDVINAPDLLRFPKELKSLHLGAYRIIDLDDMKLPEGLHTFNLVSTFTTLEHISFPEGTAIYTSVTNEFLDRLDGFSLCPSQQHIICIRNNFPGWDNTILVFGLNTPCTSDKYYAFTNWSRTIERKLVNASNRTWTKAVLKSKRVFNPLPYSLQAWYVRTSYLLGGVAWEDVDSAL